MIADKSTTSAVKAQHQLFPIRPPRKGIRVCLVKHFHKQKPCPFNNNAEEVREHYIDEAESISLFNEMLILCPDI